MRKRGKRKCAKVKKKNKYLINQQISLYNWELKIRKNFMAHPDRNFKHLLIKQEESSLMHDRGTILNSVSEDGKYRMKMWH